MTDVEPTSPTSTTTKRKRRKKTPFQKFKKRLKKPIVNCLVWIGCRIIPLLYLGYCKFVWMTSKVDDHGSKNFQWTLNDNPPYKFVAVLWHQEVFTVAWCFRHLNGTTIASRGRVGEIITAMLKWCNYTVFRGGSSRGGKRKKAILEEFTDHLIKQDRAAVGVTVDGSHGPPFRLKSGAIVMAAKLGCPILAVHTWYKRRLLFPSWDRTAIPLPFNHISIRADGPYFPPEGILDDKEKFETYRQELEHKLLDTAYRNFKAIDGEPLAELIDKFPEYWSPPHEEELEKTETQGKRTKI